MKVTVQGHKDYNKRMRQIGAKEKTYDEYVAYVLGKMPRKKRSAKKDLLTAKSYTRPSPIVPSGEGISSYVYNKKPMEYSGERKLLGIAVMHKSNLVPVFDENDAEDISKMRRN